MPRLIAISAAIAIFVALLCSGLFLFFGYWTAGLDKSALATKLRAVALSGGFSATIRPFPLRPNYAAEIWRNNECMILFMLVASGDQTRLQEAISPLKPHRTTNSSCPSLIEHLTQRKVAGSFYHRYLHGYRAATALLLQALPVAAIPTVLMLFLHALVGSIIVVAGTRAWQAKRYGLADTSAVGLAYASIGIALLLFWGLAYYGTSISFAFGDAAVLLLVLTFLLLDPMQMSDKLFFIVCSIGGAFVAWLEFLTGQIPLAAATIPICLLASSFGSDNHVGLLTRSLLGPATFIATGALCFFMKYALAAVVFGTPVLSDISRELMLVTVGALGPELTPKAQALFEWLGLPVDSDGSTAHRVFWLFASLALSTPIIGLGSFFLGAAITIGATLALMAAIVVAARLAQTPMDYARIGATGISFALLCGWYAVFSAHATYHSSFMVRPLALLPALAAMAWLQALMAKRRHGKATVAAR